MLDGSGILLAALIGEARRHLTGGDAALDSGREYRHAGPGSEHREGLRQPELAIAGGYAQFLFENRHSQLRVGRADLDEWDLLAELRCSLAGHRDIFPIRKMPAIQFAHERFDGCFVEGSVIDLTCQHLGKQSAHPGEALLYLPQRRLPSGDAVLDGVRRGVLCANARGHSSRSRRRGDNFSSNSKTRQA